MKPNPYSSRTHIVPPRRRHPERPNYTLRRATALGLIVLSGLGIKSLVNRVTDQVNRADLAQQLEHPIGEVRQALADGKIDKDKVMTVTMPMEDASAYGQAAALSPDAYKRGMDLPEIINAELGPHPTQGEEAIVPKVMMPQPEDSSGR